MQRRESGLFFVETAESDGLELPLRRELEARAARYIDKEIVLGIRPEHISNKPKANGSSVPLSLAVEISEPMGSESLVYLKAGRGSVIARIHGEQIFHLGEQVTAYFDLDKAALFDPSTENVIG